MRRTCFALVVLLLLARSVVAQDITDSFNRANSTSTLGNTDTGQAWVVLADSQGAGTPTWGIISNTAYVPTPKNKDVAVVESGVSDTTIQVTISTAGGAGADEGIVFRCVDSTNFFFANIENTTPSINIWKVVAGSFFSFPGSLSVSDGDVLSVVLSGTSIIVKVNGTTQLSTTDATFQTATRHGLYDASGGVARFNDFSITRPAATARSSLTLMGVGPR